MEGEVMEPSSSTTPRLFFLVSGQKHEGSVLFDPYFLRDAIASGGNKEKKYVSWGNLERLDPKQITEMFLQVHPPITWSSSAQSFEIMLDSAPKPNSTLKRRIYLILNQRNGQYRNTYQARKHP